MTEKLYYTDVTSKDFTARVELQQETPQGPAVCLDRTAFYPTSGGQQHDVGTINDIAVRDVWSDAEGRIWHLLEKPLDASSVRGSIDWEVRFDHMQQHSGQHLLSAAFMRLLKANTLSVHMGTAINTVDLDLPQLSWEEAFRVEEEVNRIIQENRRVAVHLVGEDALADFNLRREPQVHGVIRIVQVEGYDASPCGGTHTPFTGQIGLVKLTAIERYKGGVRVTFLCGMRALRDYRHKLQILQRLSLQLSAGSDDFADAVAKLQEEIRMLRRSQQQSQQMVAEIEAQQLWQATPVLNGARRIVKYWETRSFSEIQALARQLRELPLIVAFLMVAEGENLRLICTRSDDLEKVDAGACMRAATKELGGRGGGTPITAQGGVPLGAPEAALEVLNKVLSMEI
ncbi:MAG: DHHA1 domain-containing protein [Anaerolineae bacterium]|jgi:alanyl-tRNA synthetase|nr:DHHA1 domain-containing protein [Anaerolineae bacterium]